MQTGKNYKWFGIFLILVSGLIHLYNAPGELKDAPYLGISFIVFFLGSIIVTIGIYRQSSLWGWGLGGLLAVGGLVGYLVSRTVGLPVSGIEDWGPPNAYLSMGVELLFIFLILRLRPFNFIAKEVGHKTE